MLFPATYPKLHGAKKLNWDVHVVSSAHSIIIVILSTPLLWNETLMQNKIFGYDFYAGQVYAIACGYFLWDTIHSIRHMKEFGLGFVFHGFCSFSVFIFSFDKLGMTGSIYQLINGIVLLSVFFCARIVFGLYMSYQTYLNVLPVLEQVPWHLVIIYSVANVVLNALNLFWFYKMIESLMKRFPSANKSRRAAPAGTDKTKRE
ncbi:hypothetical protein BGZ50_006814 [Haplosporangium sp. Z 11]|nr:hypothetical protein BGZ50_006814 [Haplosporangium sp. Z 11]